jgi:transcriptional regulator with XRE-family HTH domain
MDHKAIKAAREAMCMTPADLAEIMEVKRPEIYRIESNVRKPPRRFIALLKALMTGYRP